MTAEPPKFEVASKRYARALELVEGVGIGLKDATRRELLRPRRLALQ